MLQHPVISVGNLTMGGVGKTPFTHWLIDECLKRNIKPVIVLKSYKGSAKKWGQVDFNNSNHLNIYGDEAFMTSKMFPTVTVLSGPVKSQTVYEFEQMTKNKFDVFILDDGFQHLSIKPDLNIVLIDASQPAEHYKFPDLISCKGRLRESISSIQIADVVLLTRVNQMHASFRSSILSKLKKKYYNSSILFDQDDIKELKKTKNIVVCSIGNPQAFLGQLRQNNISYANKYIKSDHSTLSKIEIDKIYKYLIDHDVKKIICTSKDFDKLNAHNLLKPYLHKIKIQFNIEVIPNEINQFFNQHFH